MFLPFRATIVKKDDTVCLSINDNAAGVPIDIIENIFDPYFSTKNEKTGTGLGLYMSKKIIEDHCNGKLTISNNDYGAEFIIVLPDTLVSEKRRP